MSRTSIVLLVIVVALGGFGLARYLMRTKPGELDIPLKKLPELPPIQVAAGDWPWWRGPTLDNHSPDANGVTKWSESENVLWKTPVAGRGHSSPIVVGDRVLLTSADEAAERQFALCFDRASGQILWEKTIHEKNLPHKHADNTYASGTPASDGQHVFVAFANNKAIHVTSLDLEGKLLWQTETGPHAGGSSSHGYAASPALWGSYVYISDDSPSGAGWIAAVHRQTGEVAWRKGHKTGAGSYGTIIIPNIGGKPLLLHVGNSFVTAMKPTDGEIVWKTKGLGEVTANTVAIGADKIFASSGYPERKLLALNADGNVVWKKESGNEIPYPPSMLWTKDYLYAVSDQGFVSCFNADTGDQQWKERLPGGYYSSPLLVGNLIYACNRDGLTTIFEANPESFTVVASNKLDAGIAASPVAVAGKLYIRTATDLYCIGKR